MYEKSTLHAKFTTCKSFPLIALFNNPLRSIENQTERLPNLTSTSPIVPLECTVSRNVYEWPCARWQTWFRGWRRRFRECENAARTRVPPSSLSTNGIRASILGGRGGEQGIVKDKRTRRWTGGNKTEYAGLRRWNRHAYKVFSKLLTSDPVFAVHVEHTITLFANAVWSGRTVLAMLRG